MNIDLLGDFVQLARNSPLVIAEYNVTLGRLEAMLLLRKEDKTPVLNHWIAQAERRLEMLKPLYEASVKAQALPLETLISIHNQWKAIQDG